ncbi:MAG: sulfatase-like hydrolase/transferase, partial [Lentisphaerae bacterium]|nr:sulfatase-like hydrolase/transferase [Lentisphaerota bacterium]
DQHRWDCVGAYGNRDIQTPGIDALADDGVRYANAFCPFPVCTPSRYSLLSGLYVHQHLGWSNHCTLPAGIDTFPKQLRRAGYRSTAVGKMHFTPTYLDVGFDEMWLAEQHGPGRYDDDYHRWLMAEGLCDRNDLEDQVDEYRERATACYWENMGAQVSNLDEAHHSTTWIGDKAMETLASWGSESNLLMVGFIKPHHPFDPPAPWDMMYDPRSLSLLPGWTESCLEADLDHSSGFFPHKDLTEASLRKVMALYYASISQIDHQVGRMINLLKEQGLYDDTLIVYTSDHGDYMGFHHLLLKGGAMYDPTMRVPLILKYPGNAGAGSVGRGLTSNVDVAPTILAAAGVATPAMMAGRDLASHPEGSPFVVGESYSRNHYMLRTDRDKLILNRDEPNSRYYDLETDPLELDNRFRDSTCQERVSKLKAMLLRWTLFQAPSVCHLDYEAPLAPAANAPVRNDGHVDEREAYFRRMMGVLSKVL